MMEAKQVVKCPQCSSQRVYKDGIRYTRFGEGSDICAETVVIGFHSSNTLRPQNLFFYVCFAFFSQGSRDL